ncbi:hypothetical protein Ddye_016860 [Dipteronia dyeriana]|uniref:Reverse transcriptase zinc-binding domain-containing protein n=1 Tax=Dipteronia dyeriana TaxID=168575 RepID=A0AAD9U861_9ROSI|nr:hypothetical protein Ddye_016860 [Dipteronia dyeriana]
MLCGSAVETLRHAIFCCKEVRRIWYGSRFGKMLANFRSLRVIDVCIGMSVQMNLEDFGEVCMLAWVNWENRNSLMNCGTVRDPDRVVNWALNLLTEFRNTRSVLLSSSPAAPDRPLHDCIARPHSLLKLKYKNSHSKEFSGLRNWGCYQG